MCVLVCMWGDGVSVSGLCSLVMCAVSPLASVSWPRPWSVPLSHGTGLQHGAAQSRNPPSLHLKHDCSRDQRSSTRGHCNIPQTGQWANDFGRPTEARQDRDCSSDRSHRRNPSPHASKPSGHAYGPAIELRSCGAPSSRHAVYSGTDYRGHSQVSTLHSSGSGSPRQQELQGPPISLQLSHPHCQSGGVNMSTRTHTHKQTHKHFNAHTQPSKKLFYFFSICFVQATYTHTETQICVYTCDRSKDT